MDQTMKIQSIALVTVFATFVSATVPTDVLAAGPEAQRETITPAFAHGVANVPGKTLTALVVTYPPGGKTPPHQARPRPPDAFAVSPGPTSGVGKPKAVVQAGGRGGQTEKRRRGSKGKTH